MRGSRSRGGSNPAVYALEEALADPHPLAQRARKLPKEEQWAVVELITQGISCHRFLACRPERAPRDYRPDFSDGAVMSYRPAPAHGGALDGQNVLARGARRVQLTPEEAGWLRRANGEVTLGELLAGASRSASTGAVKLCEDLWERGHVVFGW